MSTPPDAVTSFAAANLAGSEPMATGIEGFRLGMAGFLVPFAFIYQPALLLQGSTTQIALCLILTAFGVICLASGVIGHLFNPLNAIQRAFLLVSAGLLVFPSEKLTILGLILAGISFAWSWRNRHTKAQEPGQRTRKRAS